MKTLKRLSIAVVLALFLLAGPRPPALATLEYDLGDALFLNWYFENADPVWDMDSHSYFHDYNSDGLPDYLIAQSNGTDKSRIFCLDTSNSPDPKVYPANRTAWREFDWQPGTFIPNDLHFQREFSVQRTPDLILVGRDSQSDFTKFIFWKLDETDPTFPTEDDWSIDVNSLNNPVLDWRNLDANGDNYPDFIIYSAAPDESGNFLIRCFNGMDGTQLWQQSLAKADDDTGGIGGFGSITVDVLSIDPGLNMTGDFDGDGKPEILIWYAYTFFEFIPQVKSGSKAKITMLKSSSGQHLSLYPGWWDVYDYPDSFSFSSGAAAFDFNKDTYVDLEVSTWNPSGDIPHLRVIDLKTKTDLFQTVNTDFGSTQEEWAGFFSSPAFSAAPNTLGDVDGDSWWDLVFIGGGGFGGGAVRYAVFHGYTDNAQKGRRMWSALADGAPYNYGQSSLTDWNGDGLMDFALVLNPSEPMDNKIEWGYALQNTGPDGPTLQITFKAHIPYTDPWNPQNDDFLSPFSMVGPSPIADIDGDGQQDSFAMQIVSIDHGKDSSVDLSLSRVLFFDNTPAGSPPDITADFLATVRNENEHVTFTPFVARDLGLDQPVDQNGDGTENDIIMDSLRAVFALSFAPAVTVPITPGDVNGDDQVTLADSILSFQVGAGEQPAGPVNKKADVNGDKKIGTAEGAYGIQITSGSRIPPAQD